MAIVKMKRLRLIGLQPDRERLLGVLQKLGCVQLREPEMDPEDPAWAALTKPDGAGLSQAKEQSFLLNHALDALAQYAPSKEGLLAGRPQVKEKDFFDDGAYAAGRKTAEEILEEEKNLSQCQAEQGRLKTQRVSLEPWASLDVPLDLEGDGTISVVFGAVPNRVEYSTLEGAVADATELAQIFPAGEDRELKYFLLICHASVERDCAEAMRAFGFSHVNLRGWKGTAEDNIRSIDAKVAELEKQEQEIRGRIAGYGDQRKALRICADRASQEIAREEGKARLMDSAQAFVLDGWLPAEDEPKLAQALAEFTCAYETAEPEEAEYPQVPVRLKNNWFTDPLNMVTNMYVLPAYDGLDPNPLMAPFFVLFFGLMMADMAYGIIMVALGWFLLKKMHSRGTMKDMGGLLILCGVTTFIFGALTGGFLGDFIPQFLKMINPNSTFQLPYLFTPLNNTIEVLIGSLVLGCIQVFTGMLISVIYKTKHGNFVDALFDEIAWWVILAGAALAIFGIGSVAGVPVVLIAGVLMLAIGGTRNEKGFGKVTGFVGSVYNGVSGFFSDILSYARLMALMLAGAVVAQVFNTLGSVTGNIVLFVIVSLVGNGLNLALNLLGCYVHDLRLQCLEFFGRFYKEGGKPYRPLSINTKYVDID